MVLSAREMFVCKAQKLIRVFGAVPQELVDHYDLSEATVDALVRVYDQKKGRAKGKVVLRVDRALRKPRMDPVNHAWREGVL